MSTILDALRKSEQERKLNKLPTLNDMAAPQEPARWPLYLGLALVFLAIALVVLAYVIWSARADTEQAGNSSAATQQSSSLDSTAVEGAINSRRANNAGGSSGNNDPMLVNVVSYSDDPALRFAMVNGKMVREGEFIEPGLKIEAILSDAVVFNARGNKITRHP